MEADIQVFLTQVFFEGLGSRHFLHHSIQRLPELLQLLQTRTQSQRHLLDFQLDGGQDVLLPAESPLTTQTDRQTQRQSQSVSSEHDLL